MDSNTSLEEGKLDECLNDENIEIITKVKGFTPFLKIVCKNEEDCKKHKSEISQALEDSKNYNMIKDESLILNPNLIEQISQLKKENEKIKEFYVCMHCHHLARLKEISKNSELRMCPHCQTQMKSFYQILKEEKDV